MKLKYQLFVTLLIASALLIALMLALSSWSFNRGFIGYVNNTEKARLAPLISDLADLYREQDGWQWVADSPNKWHDLIINNRVENRRGPGTRAPGPPNRPPGPRPNRGARLSELAAEPDLPHPPPPGHASNTQPSTQTANQRQRPPRRISNWLLLADSNRKILIGKGSSRNPSIEWLAIDSDDKTVGYLGFKRYKQLDRQIDKAFAKRQKRTFGLAALGMVLLSALLSVPLSSRIIKPLLTVKTAVNEISHGNFDYRISSSRKDEFGDLTNHINSLALRLDQNKTARQQWIAEISHELRTPVAVLQSEIEAMQDGIRPTDEKSIESLHQEVLQLSRLINDLHQLSLSDLGALEYKMQTLSLTDIAETFLDSNASALAEADLTLKVSLSRASIFGDQQRIIQLLENLLQNSIRYTHAGGSLDVELKVDQDQTTLRWADSTPGVDEKDLHRLFDPLYRTEASRNRQHGGSGLGLAIVQKIVVAHEGHIEARHAEAGGLEITISFPRQQDATS